MIKKALIILIATLLSPLCHSWSASAATLAVDDIIATDIGTSAVTTDQAVLKISPANGDRTVLSGNGIGIGAAMNTPNTGGAGASIASTPSGVIYFYERLAAANPKTIIRVDLATGNRTVISGNGVGAGTPFTNCTGISWDL